MCTKKKRYHELWIPSSPQYQIKLMHEYLKARELDWIITYVSCKCRLVATLPIVLSYIMCKCSEPYLFIYRKWWIVSLILKTRMCCHLVRRWSWGSHPYTHPRMQWVRSMKSMSMGNDPLDFRAYLQIICTFLNHIHCLFYWIQIARTMYSRFQEGKHEMTIQSTCMVG